MRIRLIDVPMDFGANRRGVDMGPSALRQAGIKAALSDLGHQVEEELRGVRVPIADHSDEGDPRVKFLDPIVEGCTALAQLVDEAMTNGDFPLVMGGDHSIAVGTLAGLGAHYRRTKAPWGVVWIDAHGDFNTPETSPSGNIHGMSLAAATGLGHPALTQLGGDFRKVDPANVVVVGARDIDSGEKQNLRNAGVTVFTMADIDRLGMAEVARRTLEDHLAGVEALHISLDVDSLDPEYAPGVGTPVRGGLTYRELHLFMETLCTDGRATSAEVVEVNPILDVRNQTALTAVEMLASLLGDTIL
jgi:arginase